MQGLTHWIIRAVVLLSLFAFAGGHWERAASADEAAPVGQADPPTLLTRLANLDVSAFDDVGADKLLASLREVSDDQLSGLLVDPLLNEPTSHAAGYELILSEVVRRGGPKWEHLINMRLSAEQAARAKDPPTVLRGWSRELSLLAALRRVQKKDDPLTILVEGKARLRAKAGSPLELSAILTNLDPERRPVTVEVGGDYRGASRHNKWRIEVRDAMGRLLPALFDLDMGGFYQPVELAYRESVPASLNLASYVSVEQPGDYSLVVMYHPELHIAGVRTVDGLICCQSMPINLTIEPITIETTLHEQAAASALVLKLPKDGPVHIADIDYNLDADDGFLPKDSVAGQLKSLGWKAVPELIKAVNGEGLTPTQRAWALGVLFGITNLRDPTRQLTVVGAYEYRYGRGRPNGAGPGQLFGSRSESGVQIDEHVQRTFAKGWRPWIENGYVKMVYPEETPQKRP